jgi:hypothetical protein
MTMWFYDEAGELEECQPVRQEVKALEREYLEVRVVLRDAEAALRADPESPTLQAKVKYYKKRVADLEKKNPRFAWDYPIEMALWSPPHG